MAKNKMPEKDLEALLNHYRGERRRLVFQLDQVRNALQDLKKTQASLPKATEKALPEGTVKRGRGRPRKGEVVANGPKRGPGRPRKGEIVVKKSKRGPGRPPKRTREPRELNVWDNMVLNAIKTTGLLLPKEDILKHAGKWAEAQEPAVNGPEVELMVTRTLQKLSSKKNLLGTYHSGLRRGNHYGLKEWFFNSSGKLRRQHLDRLVLKEQED